MGIPFFRLAVFMFVLGSLPLVSAAPVTDLNITLVNAPATTNKDLNFQATWSGGDVNRLYWRFDSDGNTTISGSSPTTLFLDTFPNLSKWTVTSGTWTTASGIKNTSGSGEIYADTGGDTNFADTGLVITWTVVATNPNAGLAICDDAVYSSCDGYRFSVASTEIKVKETTGGSEGTSAEAPGLTIGANDVLQVRIDQNGLFRYRENGIDRISVYDTNHNSFRYIVLPFWSLDSEMDDLNVVTIAFTSDIESGSSQTHTFSTPGTKNIQLTAENVDGNASTEFNLSVTGGINITLWDENAVTKIPGATVDFNGGSYTTDAQGQLNIPLASLPSSNYDITISATDYQTRVFNYDFNSQSDLDVNFTLLKNTDGKSITFKYYKPDKITPFPQNSVVEIRRETGSPNTGISGRKKVSTNNTIDFFLQQYAQDYNVLIRDADTNITYDYNNTILTVKNPIDEVNTGTLTPWSLQVGNLSQISFANLSGDHNTTIFSDTVDFYTLLVDKNALFYQRNYLFRTKGGTATATIQPYLLLVSDSVQVTWLTLESLSETTIGGIRLDSFRSINNQTTLVEQRVSDSTGSALLSFTPGVDYNLVFYKPDGNFIFSGNYTPSSSDTKKKAFLAIQNITVSSGDEKILDVNFVQADGFVRPNSPVDFNQVIRVLGGNFTTLVTKYTHNNVVLATQTYDITDANGSSVSVGQVINTSGLDQDYPIVVNVQGTVDGKILGYSKSYFLVTRANNLIEAARNAGENDFGKSFAAILAVFLTIGFVFVVNSFNPFNDPSTSALLAIPFMGIFVYFGWISWLPFLIGMSAAAMSAFMASKGQGRV